MTLRDADLVVDYSVRARFDELCRYLANGQAEHRLHRSLGYWALVGDRRLPYALLDLSLRQVIQTPFSELSKTRGVGAKKLRSLLVLLERAAQDPSPATPAASACPPPVQPDQADTFLFESVCESHWESWRQTVRTHQLAQIPLGRLAPSLAAIPSVIWDSPLAVYLDTNLAAMREMKSHGDKRLRVVVEVFFHIHRALGPSHTPRHLTLSLRPVFACGIEQWLGEVMPKEDPPCLEELRNNLILPLLNQIELDAGSTVGQLAAGRLGVESAPESVIEQSERMQVTRARIYQLLETCSHVMAVRWPEGRWQLASLAQRYNSRPAGDPLRVLLGTLQLLLYPDRPQAGAPREPALAATELVTAHGRRP